MVMWAIITLTSAFFFAVKDIFAKKLFKKDVSPNQVVFEEYFLLLIAILIFFFYKIEFGSYVSYWHFYLMKALSVGGATLLYFQLLKKYEISLVSPLMNLSPLILLFLSSMFLGEDITAIQIVGIFLIILSTYFLEIIVAHHHREKPHKHHFINMGNAKSSFFLISLLMITTISIAAIADKMILEVVDVYTNMYFTSLIVLIVMIGYYIQERALVRVFKNMIREPETLVISIFANVSNYLILIAIAIPSALVSLIIPLRRTSTLMSSLIGGMLFHEKHLGKKMIATLGMLVGVLLIVL